MPYVTPRTWVAGDVLTAAQLNQDVRDNVLAVANPAACRVYHNAAVAVADATITVLGTTGATTAVFNSERYDTDSMHSTGTNPGRITINTAGIYLVTAGIEFAAGTDYSSIYLAIRKNGTTIIVNHSQIGGNDAGLANNSDAVSTVYKFAVADYIEVLVWQNNTANLARNLAVAGEASPEFSATRLGIG